MRTSWVALLLGAIACGSPAPAIIDGMSADGSIGDGANGDGDAMMDGAGSEDATMDAGVDAATTDDAAIDAATDAGDDATPIDADVGDDATPIDADVGDDATPTDDAAIDATPTDDAAIDATPAEDAAIDATPTDDAAIDATPAEDAAIDASVPVPFYWADWTEATAGSAGVASATFAPPTGTVTVRYAGEIRSAQTAGGTNFWLPSAPYVNDVTANPPPDSDIVTLVGNGGTNTVTFDPPVTGLVMAILSLGQPSAAIRYAFDQPMTVLSFGAGYWGNGTLAAESPTVLVGAEGHGAIQFSGTISQLSWTVIGSENWHGFTFGVPAQPAPPSR